MMIHEDSKAIAARQDQKDRTIKALIGVTALTLVCSVASTVYLASRPASQVIHEVGYLVNDTSNMIPRRFTDLEEIDMDQKEKMAWRDLTFYMMYRHTYGERLELDSELAMMYSSPSVAAAYTDQLVKLFNGSDGGNKMRTTVQINSLVLQPGDNATMNYTKTVTVRGKGTKKTTVTALLSYAYFQTPNMTDDQKRRYEDFNPFGFQVTSYEETPDRNQVSD